jgi:hypothetical protein
VEHPAIQSCPVVALVKIGVVALGACILSALVIMSLFVVDSLHAPVVWAGVALGLTGRPRSPPVR